VFDGDPDDPTRRANHFSGRARSLQTGIRRRWVIVNHAGVVLDHARGTRVGGVMRYRFGGASEHPGQGVGAVRRGSRLGARGKSRDLLGLVRLSCRAGHGRQQFPGRPHVHRLPRNDRRISACRRIARSCAAARNFMTPQCACTRCRMSMQALELVQSASQSRRIHSPQGRAGQARAKDVRRVVWSDARSLLTAQ